MLPFFLLICYEIANTTNNCLVPAPRMCYLLSLRYTRTQNYTMNHVSRFDLTCSVYMIRRCVCLLGTILYAVIGNAQGIERVPQMSPMTPDAAAMFKVLERPLGAYTGTAPISFPLLSLSSGSLTANLSLNYNSTGGIRVSESASCVGLGFSLNDGGGRIVQQVNGLPDDMTRDLVNHEIWPVVQSQFDCSNVVKVWNVLHSISDLDPDIFYYNFNGVNGKFLIQQDGTIELSDNTGIKIEADVDPTPNIGVRKWIITDAAGNKYYFGRKKDNTGDYFLSNSALFPTKPGDLFSTRTWYLAEVRDMNDENVIQYSYVDGSRTLFVSGANYKKLPLNFLNGGTPTVESWYSTATIVNNMVMTETEKVVSRIDGKNGYILVNSDPDRRDRWGGKLILLNYMMRPMCSGRSLNSIMRILMTVGIVANCG